MARKTQAELHPTTVGKYRELVPIGTKHFVRQNLKFDDYTQTMVLDFISDGETLSGACRAAGVNTGTLAQWLQKGKACTDETDAYFLFYQRYKHARLKGLRLLRERQRMRREDPQGYGDLPIMNSHNPLPLALFTEENRQSILAYLEKGTFPGVAAEASGVPYPIYMHWVERGREEMYHQGDGDIIFLDFYLDVMKTSAQARAQAEGEVYSSMPLAWLMHGPARDQPDNPGWTKQQVISGPQGKPIQIETTWKTAEKVSQAIEVEGSVTEPGTVLT